MLKLMKTAFDEAMATPAQPRGHYAELIRAVKDAGPRRLAARLDEDAERVGLSFSRSAFRVDPLPRLLESREWEHIVRGATQRARALNRLCADVYGERRIVEAGVMPGRVIDGAELYEPAMRGVRVPAGAWACVVGLDLVRDPDGRFLVLEDNARSPSGTSFAWSARRAVSALDLPGDPQGEPREAFEALGVALRAAAPAGVAEPAIAVFSEGPGGAAFFEHELIAEALDLPIVTAADLTRSGDRLVADVEGGPLPVDVLYRRIDGERLTAADGSPTELGELLIEPLLAGTVTVANAFGSGVADDKLTHAYVEEAIAFYLGEEPILRSVPTFDLGEAEGLAETLDRLPELVVKPRSGLGGRGVLIGPRASDAELAAARSEIEAAPERFVAQETVTLSTHPSAVGDELRPRHVDLRPFAMCAGDEVLVPRAALTRFAPEEGEMIVNSSRGGGAKDTWVLA